MNATYISEAIETLQSTIFMHVRHRTLKQYTGEPILRAPQLFFIQLPFLMGMARDHQSEISAVTVGIVHASLEEHDKIKEQEATSKEQQLTVLSGDYYSGRYYQLLAQSENILLIQKLSQAIVKRCEQQITVYEGKQRPFTEWVTSLQVIQTELITQYYTVIGFERFVPLMQETLTIVRLQDELHNMQQGRGSRFSDVMITSLNEAETIDYVMQQEIQARQAKVQTLLQDLHIDASLVDYMANLGGFHA